jgi:serine/threonine protein kinase/tetratricopeptide (TPR) repeat protein
MSRNEPANAAHRLDPRRVESVFNDALARPVSERADILDQVCGADAALRARVKRLLDLFEQRAEVFEDPPMSLLEDDSLDGEVMRPGQRIGPYELVRNLASGGMGTVWLARRADEHFDKRVALKLIKRGMDSDALLARFRAERQVLASLEHPNIARLLDGGITEDGLPYLVMEFVDGLPIDRFCDENRLTIPQRLQLFRTMCAAVQFAHQNLVIHRDLKPSNILVTADGIPKLLDFGIAKVIHPDGSDATAMATVPELRIMTPRYASPEQVRSETITTASDVYSLGVVLYELLSGHEPYDLATRSRSEYEQAICSQEPQRPSTIVGRAVTADDPRAERLALTPQAVSAARLEDPNRLRRRLSGDLDMIVLKALRKEPQRRYLTVEQLSEDIRRHLAHLPIRARPDSWRYRARKMVARNTRLVAAAALAIATLIAGTIVSTTLYVRSEANRRRAEAESRRAEIALRAKAEQVARTLEAERRANNETSKGKSTNQFLNDMLEQWLVACRAADPVANLRASLDATVRDLDSGKKSYESEVEAIVRLTIGETYRSIGLPAVSESHFRRSLELRRKLFGDRDPRVAESMERLGRLYRSISRLAEAAEMIEGALAIRKMSLPTDDGYFAVNYNSLGMLKRSQGKYNEALEALRESLRVYRLIGHPGDESIPVVLANMGTAYLEMGKPSDAETVLRESIELGRKIHGEKHVHVGMTESLLGWALYIQGDADRQAEAWLRNAMDVLVPLLGRRDPQVAIAQARLAACLQDAEHTSEAELLIQESLGTLLSQNMDREAARAQITLGQLLQRDGRLEEAEAAYREGMDRMLSLSADDPILADNISGLGQVYARMGCIAEAKELLHRADAMIQHHPGAATRMREANRRALAELFEKDGPVDAPRGHFVQAKP